MNDTNVPRKLVDYAVTVKSPDGSQRHNGDGYAETLRRLRELPGCVGAHLCGAYLRNEARKRALRDASERPDEEALRGIVQANRETAAWVDKASEGNKL